ncbi:MAG: 23S rRNA (pseudouridine(1915)-N(3))-methyltransferase RlmH [Rhodospirillaceae bacterium]
MNIVIAAVGRMKNGPEKSIIDTYLTRLPWSVDIREIDHKNSTQLNVAIRSETQALLDLVPKRARTICLDSRGKSMTSNEFADRVRAWRDDGFSSLAFLIGGPNGLEKGGVDSTDLALSFGRATWPHMLVRAMLVEQLYRTHCILTEHPYHRRH